MMHHISKILVFTFLLQLLFFSNRILAGTDQENPLTKAIQLFDKRKYIEAETAFKKLIDERPDDFMINYYYGSCRTENSHYSDADLAYLEKAIKEVYPIDIDYYFGVQYHARNRFNTAIIHYNNYRKVADKEEQTRVKLADLIGLCEQQINPFMQQANKVGADSLVAVQAGVTAQPDDINIAAAAAIPTSVLVAVSKDTTAVNNNVAVIDETPLQTEFSDSTLSTGILPVAGITEPQPEPSVQIPTESIINFNINSDITYLFESNFKTSEGANFFNEGSAKSAELEPVVVRTEILREQYSKSKTKAEKDSLGQLIVELENEIYQLKSEVKQLLVQARTAENNYWQNASDAEKVSFINELESAGAAINKAKAVENETAVSGILIAPLLVEDALVAKPAKEVKSTGVNYKIQLGAYSKGIPNNMKPVFKKISMIRKVENYIDDKGVVVYTTGNLTNYDDATLMLNQVKQEGVKDALIAAYQNGKRITLEQAKETEKQK